MESWIQGAVGVKRWWAVRPVWAYELDSYDFISVAFDVSDGWQSTSIPSTWVVICSGYR